MISNSVLIFECIYDSPEDACEHCAKHELTCTAEDKVLGPRHQEDDVKQPPAPEPPIQTENVTQLPVPTLESPNTSVVAELINESTVEGEDDPLGCPLCGGANCSLERTRRQSGIYLRRIPEAEWSEELKFPNGYGSIIPNQPAYPY